MKRKIIKSIIFINLILVFIFCLSSCNLKNKKPIKLESPVVSVSNSGVASWKQVSNAIGYVYKINNGNEISTTELFVQLADSDSIIVKAVGNGIDYIDSNYSNSISYKYSIGLQIQDEYNALKAGTTTNHTEWFFTGKILDMTATKFNDKYQTYNVRLILDVDGVLIGIYDGQVNGSYPTDISGLKVGIELTVKGIIQENYTVNSGEYTALIEFAKPNISWTNNNDNDNHSNTVNFFMINDTHGAFLDSSSSVSIGRVDTLINELESSNGQYIKIQNGDAFQGSYVAGVNYGLPLVEALNVMDFDAFVLGNHEFDWGIDKIAAYKDGDESNGEANFPFLGANIYYKGTTTRPDWIEPYTIVNYGDVKVGIIGVIGEYQESSILTRYISDYEFVNPLNLIKQYAKELRISQGCEVVVVATHEYDQTLNKNIASLSGDAIIDSIFCAHTHELINESLKRSDGVKIPVVQNYHKNNKGTEIVLKLDDDYNMIDYDVHQYSPANYKISDEINMIIGKYEDIIDEANMSLGKTSSYISKSLLGEYATDAMIDYIYNEAEFDGEIDVAIMNTGGIRATIDSGEITKSDIYEVFPFNNVVILVNLDGASLKKIYNENSKYIYVDFSDSISSIYSLDDDAIYQLAVIDYVFESTYSSYDIFDKLDPSEYVETNIIMRDILIEYMDALY